MLYIDTCTYDDYDKAVKFLLDRNIKIVKREKVKMTIAAEISLELANQMRSEVNFEETVSIGKTELY